MIRRLVIAALLAGLAAGLALAAILPRTEPSGAAPRDAAAVPGDPRPAPAGDPAHPRRARALHAPTGPGYARLRATTPPRIEVRMRDPRGGPDWAVRTFAAKRLVTDPGEPPHVVGRPMCAQLGRIHRGRFGWVDASNTFRPVGVVYFGAPLECGSTRPDLGRRPFARAFSRVTDPTAAAARALQTVAWGRAGSAGRVRLRVAGRELTPPRTPNGVFLVLAPAEVQVGEIGGEVAYGGGTVPLKMGSFPGRSVIEFRSPDPNGGLTWGITAARRDDGRWCSSGSGRVVDDRVGAIDFALGTFTDNGPDPNGPCADHSALGLMPPPAGDDGPTRERPLRLNYSFGRGNPEEYGSDPVAGRIARRTLSGMTTIQGVAHPDVETITFTSPRDVRTLRPSPRAHAFMVLYDGTFPTGSVTLTATFGDGSTATEKIGFEGP